MRIRIDRLIIGLLVCLPNTGSANQDIQARFEKSLRDAKSIPNVEIQWLDTLRISDPAALKALGAKTFFSRTFEYSFIASSEKYHATCKLVSGTQTNLVRLTESAFDGKIYRTYSADSHQMTKGSKKPAGDNAQSLYDPLVAPFIFLAEFPNDHPPYPLNFTDITSDGFDKGVTLPAARTSDGLLEVSMPNPASNKAATSWKYAIDTAGDSFTPSTITGTGFFKGGYVSVCKLSNYTNLGPYKFPTLMKITVTRSAPTNPPTLMLSDTIRVISARIPGRVAESAYRLGEEEKSAISIWDSDQLNLTKSAHTNSLPSTCNQTRSNTIDNSGSRSKP